MYYGMATLEIRFYGDPVLREKAQPIAEVTDEIRRLAADMADTMYEAPGVGLAANQVGVLKQILVVDASDREERKRGQKRAPAETRNPEFFLNPEILEESDEDDVYNEGCLSIPEVEADVYRPVRVRARWVSLDGEECEEWIEGFRARVFQHEVDHLNGVLFTDRLGLLAKTRVAGRLRRLREETEARLAGAQGA